MEPNDNGNGHKTIEEMAVAHVFKGATLKLSELQRQDGLIAESIDKANQHNLGVIQSVLTAVKDDKDYRQIIKNALWRTTEEQDKAINAMAVCDITGAEKGKKIILDRLTARSAGINGAMIHEGLEALTHTTFTTQHIGENKKKWWQNDNRNKSSSPLSQ